LKESSGFLNRAGSGATRERNPFNSPYKGDIGKSIFFFKNFKQLIVSLLQYDTFNLKKA
jgi:hypothetical protein